MSGKRSADNHDVENIRREYARQELLEGQVADHPVDQFKIWFEQALGAEATEPNAMSLATASKEGIPSVRIVLLKGFDKDGFRFFTNYESRKAKELEENSYASLCLFWPALERQVRIEGDVVRLSREESDLYFQKRPRESQLGAWASKQSREVASREELEKKFKQSEVRFDSEPIPTPEFWGGYRVQPTAIEFWQGRPGRMHDRILYTKEKEGWKILRLFP